MVVLTALIEMALLLMVVVHFAPGSGDFAGNRADPIEVQFQQIKSRMHEKWSEGQHLLPSLHKTHAPVEVLKEKANCT